MAINQVNAPDCQFKKITALTNTDETEILAADTSNDRIALLFRVTSDDTASTNVFALYGKDGSLTAPIESVTLPATPGTTGTTHAINILGLLASTTYNSFSIKDNPSNYMMLIPKGCSLRAKMSAITAGKTVWVDIKGFKYAVA